MCLGCCWERSIFFENSFRDCQDSAIVFITSIRTIIDSITPLIYVNASTRITSELLASITLKCRMKLCSIQSQQWHEYHDTFENLTVMVLFCLIRNASLIPNGWLGLSVLGLNSNKPVIWIFPDFKSHVRICPLFPKNLTTSDPLDRLWKFILKCFSMP